MSEILSLHGDANFEAPVAPVFVLSEAISGLGKIFRKLIYLALLATAACESAGVDDAINVTASRCPPGQTDPNPTTPNLVYCVPDAELAKCYKQPVDSSKEYTMADSALATGPIKLRVIRVYEPEVDPIPTTYNAEYTDNLKKIYFDNKYSAANFFSANSDGHVDIKGSVDDHPLGVHSRCYGKVGQVFLDDLLEAAKEIPGSEEFNAYSFVLTKARFIEHCGYSTIGAFPEGSAHPGIRVNFINGDGCAKSTSAHELGHGLGLRHADAYNAPYYNGGPKRECPTDLPLDIADHLDDTCIEQYGDNTLMGRGYEGGKVDLDVSQRSRLGAKVPSETVTAPGTFSLIARTVPSVQSLGPEQLLIPTSDGFFSLEYNNSLKGLEGVQIRFVLDHMSNSSGTDTLRIQNANPYSGNRFEPGDVWTDVGRGISVTFGYMTDGKATIVVNSFKH